MGTPDQPILCVTFFVQKLRKLGRFARSGLADDNGDWSKVSA
jgi:hypothetical protein